MQVLRHAEVVHDASLLGFVQPNDAEDRISLQFGPMHWPTVVLIPRTALMHDLHGNGKAHHSVQPSGHPDVTRPRDIEVSAGLPGGTRSCSAVPVNYR
jgi:hypothetical protein